MGRTTVRVAAIATLAALFAGTATAGFAAAPSEVPTPVESSSDRYIVVLKAAPLATYSGGTRGIAPTVPAEGTQLDARSVNAQRYLAHLKRQQGAVAASVDVRPAQTYQVALNGFSADLTGAEVATLRASSDVIGVYADEVRHPAAVIPPTEFLGLGAGSAGTGGVWDALGGVAEAGKGVVVGVIDTGIAWGNPSFAGERLTSKVGAEPYVIGDDVVFDRADGGQFRTTRVTGPDWSRQSYSTKIVGGRHFDSGAEAAGFAFASDVRSPQDGDGHGSHAASIAVGNVGVPASVEGIDFGTISGIAPAAKVAAYKACWSGPDTLDSQDDVCALSDLIAAIDTAVADGVDVIDYSIGGGSASSTVLQPEDMALFNAAAAGIFVAVSAGNGGPGAATVEHAAPWYTTVAASTIPTYEGTVELPTGDAFAGASVSVPFGSSVSGPAVYAGDIPATGAAAADAALCLPDSVSRAAATGKIVICDRGVNARLEKSSVVEEAGGTGMVLVNVSPSSLDNDFHPVPTVHVPDTARDLILAYVQSVPAPQLTLSGANTTGTETPTPQVAGFSARGPMLSGGEVLTPDVTAPGVAILAATHGRPSAPAAFGFLSGTSMAASHVAGLGALYLAERPLASPAEVKSALMTTAYDTVDADDEIAADPFAQGAGHVDPTRLLTPGLLYLNGPLDWEQYLQGAGIADLEIVGIDPSDLNLASIRLGALARPQTVTRTVTSTGPGTYTASVEVPGVDAVVEPGTIEFGAAGETRSFTVSFTPRDAEVEQWATGFLTWSGDEGDVRSPVAVFPVAAAVPAWVDGSGASGRVDVDVVPGTTEALRPTVSGLAPVQVLAEGSQSTGSGGFSHYVVDVAVGAELARFAIDSSDDTGSDMDLFVYRVVSPTDWRYYETWASATSSADEAVQLEAPTPGTYLVEVQVRSHTAPFSWRATSAVVTPRGAGSPTASAVSGVAQGEPARYTVSWSGLAPGAYLGVVRYGDSQVRTVVSVTAR